MTGLTPATTYVFKMRACNGPNRCSDWTANQTFTTLAGTVTPGRVTNLRHSSSGDNSVTLAWNAPGNSAAAAVTSYHVQNRPLEAAWPGGFDVAQGAGTTTFTVSQLVDGTIYEFQVRACNAAGCGDWNTLRHPDHVIVAGHKVGNASLIPASASLAVGARLGVGIHDIPKGKVAYAQMYGAIQPAGRCSSARQHAGGGAGAVGVDGVGLLRHREHRWLRAGRHRLAAGGQRRRNRTLRPCHDPVWGRRGLAKWRALMYLRADEALYVDLERAETTGGSSITHYDLQYRAKARPGTGRWWRTSR